MANNTKNIHQQTFRDIVAIFFFEKKIFIATFIGVIAAAILTSFLFPPIYEVNAKLLVKPQNSKPLTFGKEIPRYEVSNRVDPQFVNTVLELLKSQPVVETVILKEKPELKNNTTLLRLESDRLKSSLKVKPLSLSHLIGVTMRGADPQLITDRLNSLLKTYISYHISVNQTNQGRLDFFNTQSDTFKSRYSELTNELADKSQRFNVVSPNLQKEANLALLKDLEIRRTDLIGQLQGLKEKLRQLNYARKKDQGDDMLAGLSSDIINSYPALVEMERTVAQLLIDRQRARNDFVAGSKPVQDAENQYGNMKLQIKDRMQRIIQGNQVNMDTLQYSIAEIDRQIEETLRKNGELTANTIRLEALQLEHAMAKENYTLYSAQQEEARINEAKDSAQFANVSVTTAASRPSAPWFPQKKKIIFLSLPLALILAMAAAAGAYAVDQRVRTPHDIISRTNLRFLGSLDEV